ncbi:MAG: hypothetical protein V4805_17605 [Pseudomonadota bacterium]
MTNPLNSEQIATASSYLAVTSENHFFEVERPIGQMVDLMTGVAHHPRTFDDPNLPDSHYAALIKHASNSTERTEDAMQAIAELLEKVGCAGDTLDGAQVIRISCLLSMVADNMVTSHSMHDGATRVLAVRKIARLQAINTGCGLPSQTIDAAKGGTL